MVGRARTIKIFILIATTFSLKRELVKTSSAVITATPHSPPHQADLVMLGLLPYYTSLAVANSYILQFK